MVKCGIMRSFRLGIYQHLNLFYINLIIKRWIKLSWKNIQYGKKRVRRNYSRVQTNVELPNLIEVQTESFKWLMDEGLKILFHEISPIKDHGDGEKFELYFRDYEFDAPKRDFDFEEQYRDFSNEELYKLLIEKDPKMCEVIHPNNRKRVLRALYASFMNEPLSKKQGKDELVYEPYIVYLNVERELLYKRINERVLKMIDDGLEREVKDLYDKGITPHAIGYQEWIPYFMGDVTLETVIDEIQKNSRHLAKRQMTWFRHQMDTHFYEVNLNNIGETIDKIYEDILVFLKKE
jgi:tRNA dimethylallyltransferase